MKDYHDSTLDSLKSRIYFRIKKAFKDKLINLVSCDVAVSIFEANWKLFIDDVRRIEGKEDEWLFTYMMSRFTYYCNPDIHLPLFKILRGMHNFPLLMFSEIRVKRPPLATDVVRFRRPRTKKVVSKFHIPQRFIFSNEIRLPDATLLAEFCISTTVKD